MRVRPVDPSDKTLIAHLLATCRFRHQHLDWQEPIQLLGQQPFLVAESGSTFAGCLACPESPQGVAWIRVVCLAMGMEASTVWEALWEGAVRQLERESVRHAACLVSGSWQTPLLQRAGFLETNTVIFFERSTRRLPKADETVARVRPLEAADLVKVGEVDHRAFGRLWRAPVATLELAFRQAADASVAEVEGRIVGYQLTTLSALGAHLARLAVEPQWQGRGIGSALVAGMLERLAGRGASRITLNTQADNRSSQELYRRLGFQQTGDRLPVYEVTW
jgi:ribosomal-protein-alanine N-acetyltransferase